MRHQRLDAKAGHLLDPLCELGGVIPAYPDAAHAGIEFDMDVDRFTAFAGGPIQPLGLFRTGDRGRDIVLKEHRLLARPEAAQAKYARCDAAPPQLRCLGRQGDAKPFDAFGLEPPRALDGTVTVSVRLDDRHDPDTVPDK